MMEIRKDSYSVSAIHIAYIFLALLALNSEYNAIFVFQAEFTLLSFHTVAISGFIFSIVGFFCARKYFLFSAIMLFILLYLGTLANLKLTHIDNSVIGTTTTTMGLFLVIVFLSFVMGKKFVLPITIANSIGLLVVSYLGTPPSTEVHTPSYYVTVIALLVAIGYVLYITYHRMESSTNRLRLANKELESANTELEITNNDLAESKQQTELVLRIMRHEANQPIHALSMMLDNLLDNASDISDLGKLQKARDSLDLLTAVFNGSYTPIQWKDETKDDMAHLPSLLNLYEDTFNSKMQLATALVGDVEYIPFSKTEIMGICQNLLKNAEKHSKPDTTVYFAIGVTHDYFMIIVSNAGQETYRTMQSLDFKNSDKQKTTGHGLGLRVVEAITSHYKGEFSMVSSDDNNVSVFVELPVKHKTICLFDNDELIRIGFTDVINSITSYDLHVFEDGSNWESHINKVKPDIVFLDIDMPGERGDAIIESARDLYPDMIFIAYTGNVRPVDQQMYAELKFDGFFPKSPYENTASQLREYLLKIEKGEALGLSAI